MTSLTSLLLQAAISLLLLVQGNPNADPALREQAITIANQAIKTATEQQSWKKEKVRPVPPNSRPTPISALTVIYPNGGEQLENSGAKDSGLIGYIRWKSVGTGSDRVSIALVNPDGKATHIADSIVNTGTYAWKYDANIPSEKYKVLISTDRKEGETTADTSDTYFTLTGNNNTTSPSITVLSPNGGEVWHPGETHRITWQSLGVSSVNIYIYDSSMSGSGSTRYITPNNSQVSATQGYYNWTIPPLNQLPITNGTGGMNYRIRIDDADGVDFSYSDGSNAPFSILDQW